MERVQSLWSNVMFLSLCEEFRLPGGGPVKEPCQQRGQSRADGNGALSEMTGFSELVRSFHQFLGQLRRKTKQW